MIHDIKIRENYACDVIRGKKTFEVRKNDRDYRVGDLLMMRVVSKDGIDAGAVVMATVSYILSDPEYVKDGYVIMGLSDVKSYIREVGV